MVKLNASSDVPAVSCVVSDGVMSFNLEVAHEFGIPEVVLFTPSACGMLGYLHFEDLKKRCYFPSKVHVALSIILVYSLSYCIVVCLPIDIFFLMR